MGLTCAQLAGSKLHRLVSMDTCAVPSFCAFILCLHYVPSFCACIMCLHYVHLVYAVILCLFWSGRCSALRVHCTFPRISAVCRRGQLPFHGVVRPTMVAVAVTDADDIACNGPCTLEHAIGTDIAALCGGGAPHCASTHTRGAVSVALSTRRFHGAVAAPIAGGGGGGGCEGYMPGLMMGAPGKMANLTEAGGTAAGPPANRGPISLVRT